MTNAHDLMIDFQQPLHVSATLRDALDLFITQHDNRHVPVVDDDGQLMGMLSQQELNVALYPLLPVEACACAALRSALALLVADVMATDVNVVDEDADVFELSDLMIEGKIIALPVVDANGKYLGMISYADVLHELAIHAVDAA